MTAEQATQVIRLAAEGLPTTVIARRVGVKYWQAYDVWRRHNGFDPAPRRALRGGDTERDRYLLRRGVLP